MSHLRHISRFLTPPWMRDEVEGERILYSLGLVSDAAVEHARQGLYAQCPSFAPADALAYHGRDRKIIRGINETPESYAARLLVWLDDHRTRGNPFTLMRQLRAYCNAAVRVRTVDTRGNWFTLDRDGSRSVLLNQGNWNWDAVPDSEWSRFWVFIYPTAGGEPWTIGNVWGGAGLTWGQVGLTWGSSATSEEVAAVRRLIRDWKPAGTRCEYVIVAFDDLSFKPDGSSGDLPNGTWNVPANRLATANYWKGTGP